MNKSKLIVYVHIFSEKAIKSKISIAILEVHQVIESVSKTTKIAKLLSGSSCINKFIINIWGSRHLIQHVVHIMFFCESELVQCIITIAGHYILLTITVWFFVVTEIAFSYLSCTIELYIQPSCGYQVVMLLNKFYATIQTSLCYEVKRCM